MREPVSAGWVVLIFFVIEAGLMPAWAQDDVARIDNSAADTVFYCNSPVAVAPDISIENIHIENSSDGIKISIANYKKGEDKLFYTGDKFASKWDDTYGNLELTGVGNAEEYEEAVGQVFYEHYAETPSPDARSFSISLLDADFLPETGHFYQYIRNDGISWSVAKETAAKMDYFGLQGYLATITSKAENDFVWTKIDGVGWIGASDAENEGTWKWVTGPEAGTVFWQGNYTGGRVNGEYSFWNTEEPNNLGNEDYAHINNNPNTLPKSWNDLPNVGGQGYYFPQGFIVEFGGMPGDPDVQLSASAVVGWSQKPEMHLANFDSLVCGELNQQLFLEFDESVSVLTRSLQPESQVQDESSFSPVVQVADFGQYLFEVEITNLKQCTYFDTLKIEFQHQPTAIFFVDDEKCRGYNLDIEFTGSTSGLAEFFWYSNDTVFASGTGLIAVEIPLGYGQRNRTVGLKVDEKGCVAEQSEPVSVTPAMDFWVEENEEGCTPLNVQFGNKDVEEIESYSWDFGDSTSSNRMAPAHLYKNDGTTDIAFDVSLTVVSTDECENTGILADAITVHPIPTIGFDFDEAVCYVENAEVWYEGSADSNDNFLWDLTDFQSHEIIENPGNSPGPFTFYLAGRPTAEIGLQVVSEFGCKTDTLSRIFKRKPVFTVSSDTIAGCPPLETVIALSTSDSVDDVSYQWDLGHGQTAAGTLAEQVYTQSNQHTDITVIATSSFTGCKDTLLLPGKVFVYPVPEANFNANPSEALISDPVIHFENLSQGSNLYKWDFGDQTTGSSEVHPDYRYNEMGLYGVSLLAENDFGCVDSAFTQVSVSFDKVFPPTAFSPNAIKEEDREFRIYSEGIVNEGYKLLIFNRWGEVIFEALDQQTGWDGRMKNGSNAPAGVYTWTIQYFDFLGKKHAQQGTVTLLF